MRALNRKLIRDLVRLRGQVLAVALVVASGVAVLVMSLTTLEALEETTSAYYDRYNFADIFATVKRAPERLSSRIAAIPGVQAVETRIVERALLDLEGFAEPVTGHLVSIPEGGESLLNRLALRAGRLVAPGRPDEVVVTEPFAEAHGLTPGDTLSAVVNGHRRDLQVVGVALSPEFVYAIGPGALMPDDERFGVLWMGEEALAAAFDLDGAFNDVSLSLLRSARAEDVIDRLDLLLDRYGGVGAFDRSDQISNWFLTNELEQIKSIASILPTIFLAVAAFLSNMVLTRLIAIERSEIGLMKAFGYSNLAVAWHYMKLVAVMAALGIVIGWIVGAWLGRFNTQVYGDLFRFPFLLYRPGPGAFAIAALVSLSAAVLGALVAVRRAATLPPAEAMRPPVPPLYRRHRGELAGLLTGWADQPTRIILRQISRWPGRSFLTSVGIGLAVAVLISSLQWLDAIDHLVETQFFEAQRQDVTVALVEAQSSEVMREFGRMPGVMAAEPVRSVAARLHAGNLSKRQPVEGVLPDSRLSLVYDVSGLTVAVPPEGLVLSTKLAEVLNVGHGDLVTVEVLEGRRPITDVPVVGLFETYIGTPAHMHIDALNRLMRERPVVSGAHLRVDPLGQNALFAELKETPEVSSVMLRQAAVDTFYETMGETLMIFVSFFVVFACTLAFGVVYNSARIALSERGRELATLRVLGFSRVEISYILLGEVALLTFVGLPLGCWMGYLLAWLISQSFATELFRVPLVVHSTTYGLAVVIGLVATVASAALVRSRLDRLDLVSVLKTRE
ncbi:ABC transporter permease [Algihabitans albus]|uniref:ABC transporter permease n=1 Tax=Algihabitans albus TaxID=2164067 RepID=UPI000E5D55C7|nr:ABC transporter permease [Algihabitans albus]